MQDSRLKAALDTHFGDDLDEMMMVAEHGCAGGVSGFWQGAEAYTEHSQEP